MKKAFALIFACGFALSVHAQVEPTFTDPQRGTNPKDLTAYQIDPITVDGDFSDWPEGLEKRVCEEFYPSYQVNSLGQSTQDNWFQVAWNDEANQLYIAGWSRDDVKVTQLSQWFNPTDFTPAGAPWFYDRWEIYFETDNSDTGGNNDFGSTSGDPGTLQYLVASTDPEREPSGSLGGQETDDAGNIIDEGTAFWINGFSDPELYVLGPDGTPPLSEAKLIIESDDPAEPIGPYTKRFEAAITLLNFFVEGLEPDPDTDVIDLGPDLNDGLGLGFDVTLMDRDGFIDDSIPDDILFLSANDEGAWIGWSEGSKGGAPELLGTVMFTLDSPPPPAPVRAWEIY